MPSQSPQLLIFYMVGWWVREMKITCNCSLTFLHSSPFLWHPPLWFASSGHCVLLSQQVLLRAGSMLSQSPQLWSLESKAVTVLTFLWHIRISPFCKPSDFYSNHFQQYLNILSHCHSRCCFRALSFLDRVHSSVCSVQ